MEEKRTYLHRKPRPDLEIFAQNRGRTREGVNAEIKIRHLHKKPLLAPHHQKTHKFTDVHKNNKYSSRVYLKETKRFIMLYPQQ